MKEIKRQIQLALKNSLCDSGNKKFGLAIHFVFQWFIQT